MLHVCVLVGEKEAQLALKVKKKLDDPHCNWRQDSAEIWLT